jgi:hypothetical protein
MIFRRLMLASASAALISAPMVASADSESDTGPTGTDAQASLDFRVEIGDYIYFQVGDATNGNVDEVLFDLATNTIESGAGGANIAADTNGTVSVVLRTNVDEVRITSDTQGGVLGAGTVEDIPFDNIVEVGGGTDIPHPAWDDATGTVIGAQGGAVIGQLTEDWTFEYDNTNAYVPGSYTATVIYTATTL